MISLLCFFVIGMVAKVFLDKTFNPKEPEPEETEKEDFPVEGEEGLEEGENPSEADEEGGFPYDEEQTDTQEDTEGF